MAIQIYNRNKPTFQEIAGNSLGTGLGKALERVVQHKISGMQRGHTQNALQALGLEEPQAQALSWLDKELLAPLIKEKVTGAGGRLMNKEATPFFEKIEKEAEKPLEQLGYLRDLYDLSQNKKLQTGISAGLQALVPEGGREYVTNTPSNTYDAALNNFIASLGGTGRSTNLLTNLIKSGKASRSKGRQAIQHILNQATNDPVRLKKISRALAARELENMYRGNVPSNYRADLDRLSQQIYQQAKSNPFSLLDRYRGESEEILDELEPGTKEGEVRTVEDENTGKRFKVVWKNGEWERVE